MKKIIAALIAITMAVTLLGGCKIADTSKESEKLSIVTTIFPEYDWVREITAGSDNVSVTMLLDKGIDLHSFHPGADDIVTVASCDMFIYVGGESDDWVEDALSEAVNKDMVVINLLDVLGDWVKEEELVEGMEGEEEEEEEEEEAGPEYDEHVWLSLKCAKILCEYISGEIGKIDASNKALYDANTKAYAARLEALDKDYSDVVEKATCKTVLFGDRFPFRYLTDDYGLDYYAAFVGCSAESEASFETITFLAGKLDELKLPAIVKLETSDGEIAETVKNASASKNQEILTMSSMQSVTAKDVQNGATYLDIMTQNLEALKKAIK